MRILITGGAGFIGSNLVEALLNEGHFVRVFDNLSTGFYYENLERFETNLNFEFMKGDICDLEECKRVCYTMDIISHQAALGSVPRSIHDPAKTNEVNIGGFLNILIAALYRGIKRIVYASSSSVYGDNKNLPKREEIIGNPLSPYSVTKLVNEKYAEVFANLYGLELIGLRYFNVFGPRQNKNGAYAAVIPLFIKSVIKYGRVQIYGDGEQSRDFTYIDNVVQANKLALFTENKEAHNQCYNIAIGESTSLNDMVLMFYKISGKQIESHFKEDRIGDVRNSLADITKARRLLNYNPTIRIEEGLGKTYDWYKSLQSL